MVVQVAGSPGGPQCRTRGGNECREREEPSRLDGAGSIVSQIRTRLQRELERDAELTMSRFDAAAVSVVDGAGIGPKREPVSHGCKDARRHRRAHRAYEQRSPDSRPRPEAQPAVVEPTPLKEEFEGLVGLTVEGCRDIGRLMGFVRELRSQPEVRLERLVGRPKGRIDVLISLRRPVDLQQVLPQINVISKVALPDNDVSGEGGWPTLVVRLAEEEVLVGSASRLPDP